MNDLQRIIQPGDIINLEGHIPVTLKSFFKDLVINDVIDLIVKVQKWVFAKCENADAISYRDNHTMIYLGDNQVFSMEPPRGCIHSLDDYGQGNNRIVSIYRMNPQYFGRSLADGDIALIREAAIMLVGIPYDIGQNANIGINALSGYPWSYALTWFEADKIPSEDITKKNAVVCSVSIAEIIAYWRHILKETTGEEIPQPWKVLNPGYWTKDQIERFPNHWDVNSTFPANYAVTQTHFSGEFLLMGKFRNGCLKSN